MANFFNKTKIQANELVQQAYTYVQNKFKQADKVFTVSSAYGQILSVLSNLSNMILYFIEDSTTEQNILTASRTQSIHGLARLAGHNPTRAIAATGEISFNVSSVPEMQGDQIIIPNFSKIKCKNNNRVYTINLINDQIRLNAFDGVTKYAQVIQGEIESQFFTGTGTPLQSFVVSSRGSILYDNFFVKVYVNSEQWKQYDSLYDIPRNGKGFIVKTGITGGLDLYFGNTYFGLEPASGAEIRVEYLRTSGDSGNLREGEDIVFEWLDPGYSITGEEIDLNETLKTDMSKVITFGANPEPTQLTRLVAPKTSRSYVFANPENYIIYLEKFNYFGVVDAFTTFDDDNLDDDNIIYLYLIPDITKRLLSNENYFTVPVDYFTLTSDEETKVLNAIEDSGSKIVTTVVKIIQPTIKRYLVNISLVVFEGYSQDVIRDTIVEKLSQYFLKLRRRDLVPASDLVRIIENVEGVDSVNVRFVSEEHERYIASNPNGTELKGLDEMGDILIKRNELPLLRGGWRDRRGVFYEDGIFTNKPCSVNIKIKRTTKKDLNSQIRANNMNEL
jgi:hypothetical protein